MSVNAEKKTENTKPVKAGGKKAKKKAPLRLANHYLSEARGIAGKMVVIAIVLVVLGLMSSALQGIESMLWRSVISAVMIFAVLAYFFSEGLAKGAFDAANSRQIAKLEKDGHAISANMDASCYHPLKVVAGLALFFAVPLALAAYLAVITKPYTYALQDLPTWMSANYAMREDVFAPLSAYTHMQAVSASEWVRVIVRLLIMPYINLFEDPMRMVQLIDRLSPVMMLSYPLSYFVGYLFGPRSDAKLKTQQKKAKRAAVRKQQKKKSLASELTGDVRAPHYGQKRESEKPKKKELI